ncbi:hypothetical protein DSO57_1014035 [Entomophthora muscae]|uniref:Uncharacterized protein n=1 Tax=Entomophthora muscae TaxID=34485 RepID=A0ACC2U3A5_9FUNG|nr:hypothetical protein DSO57_1014035 [Entomophthora muscae]
MSEADVPTSPASGAKSFMNSVSLWSGRGSEANKSPNCPSPKEGEDTTRKFLKPDSVFSNNPPSPIVMKNSHSSDPILTPNRWKHPGLFL